MGGAECRRPRLHRFDFPYRPRRDAAAMQDMFAALSRRPMPESYNHLDEIIADLQAKLRMRPVMRFLKSALAEMKGLKEQLNNIVKQQGAAFEPEQKEIF